MCKHFYVSSSLARGADICYNFWQSVFPDFNFWYQTLYIQHWFKKITQRGIAYYTMLLFVLRIITKTYLLILHIFNHNLIYFSLFYTIYSQHI